jgi:hypothetical protein
VDWPQLSHIQTFKKRWKQKIPMDKKDLRDPVMSEFAKHHRILAERLIRDDRTGCLEYHGPPGRYSGNPILHIDHGRTPIHLRRYIWILHKRRIPKGLEVRMTCLNPLCQHISHMKIGRKAAAYVSSPREYITRINHGILRAILFYREKSSSKAVGDAFGYSESQIRGIWKSKKLSALEPAPGWRPSRAIEQKVEEATASQGVKFYLSKATLKTALSEIKKAKVSPLHRMVVSEILLGGDFNRLSSRLARSKNAVMYLYRRGLVELTKSLGRRKWIDYASLGRISIWRQTPYTWKLKH